MRVDIVRILFKLLRVKEIFLLSSIILSQAFLVNLGYATQVHTPLGVNNAKTIPSFLLKFPEQRADHTIIVDKSAQKVFLYHKDNIFKPVRIFKCSTGKNLGSKNRRNDKKTPEGIYFITRTYLEKELAPIYGSRAFAIDYPNPLDKMRGKSGYGIWFHGTNQPLKPRDTKGCIALENGDIDELAGFIKLHETPVIIVPKIELVYPDSLKQERDEVETIIEGWKKTWENKDISNYVNFYSPRFSAQGMGWHGWKAHKSRLARKYSEIEVNIDNLQLIKVNGIILAIFDQEYHNNKFDSRGEKRLYLAQNSNKWKIIGEFFKGGRIAKKAPSRLSVANLSEIKNFINIWKSSWEQKNINTYIGFYDKKFRSQGMDLKAWKRYKKKLNKKYQSIEVQISKLKIIRFSANRVRVRFRQSFQAGTYRDLGVKNLFLVKGKEGWKIKKETWRKTAGKV